MYSDNTVDPIVAHGFQQYSCMFRQLQTHVVSFNEELENPDLLPFIHDSESDDVGVEVGGGGDNGGGDGTNGDGDVKS